MEVGGGVPGKDVGTAPDTMTEGGVITGECQVFTDIFMLVGEMISGIIDGEGNRGNITGCITMIFVTIGVTGKEQSTGTREDLVGAVVVDLVIPVEVIPVEVNLVEVNLVEVNLVEEDLVSVEENPVYNLIPIIREMKDYKKDRIEDKAAKLQTAA